MSKLIKKMMAAVVAGVIIGVAGCGLDSDAYTKGEVEKLIKEHISEVDEVMAAYEIDKCENFNVASNTDEKKEGTIDIKLKNKKTGKIETLTYTFVYNKDSGELSVVPKDPEQIVKLVMATSAQALGL